MTDDRKQPQPQQEQETKETEPGKKKPWVAPKVKKLDTGFTETNPGLGLDGGTDGDSAATS